jgi:hypothetical protein
MLQFRYLQEINFAVIAGLVAECAKVQAPNAPGATPPAVVDSTAGLSCHAQSFGAAGAAAQMCMEPATFEMISGGVQVGSGGALPCETVMEHKAKNHACQMKDTPAVVPQQGMQQQVQEKHDAGADLLTSTADVMTCDDTFCS